MKKIYNLLLVSILFFSGTISALAFNKDEINISLQIMSHNLIENNKLTVFLFQDIKENNPSIYYQFISATEEEVANVMNQSNVIRNTYNQCVAEAKENNNYDELLSVVNDIRNRISSSGELFVDNDEYREAYDNYIDVYNSYVNEYNACVNTYDSSLKTIFNNVPSFNDNNWIEKNIDREERGNVYYDIPLDSGYYWIWIKAKDAQNKDIYQLITKKSDSLEQTNIDEQVDQSMPGDVIDNQDDSQPVVEAKINKQVVNVPSTAAFSNFIIGGIVILSAALGAIVYLVILKKQKDK